jgi:hypothetical protein
VSIQPSEVSFKSCFPIVSFLLIMCSFIYAKRQPGELAPWLRSSIKRVDLIYLFLFVYSYIGQQRKKDMCDACRRGEKGSGVIRRSSCPRLGAKDSSAVRRVPLKTFAN